MEASTGDLQAGSRIPVIIERIVKDTMVVTLDHGDRCFTDNQSGTATTVPGVLPQYPPYFEGAPFPQPLWVRHTYNQWVPQPPPRRIKRTKRRNKDSGRLTISTIRLRPRQVLCEKCKNTLNSDEDSKDGQNAKSNKRENEIKEGKKLEETEPENKKCKKEKKDEERFLGEVVPHSPVIKISYSTPQGKGEVMKIPSRVHGSVKPFCPRQLIQNGEDHDKSKDYLENKNLPDKPTSGTNALIPKLKLTRPVHSTADVPPPKIRLKPQINCGDNVSIYQSELVDGTRRHTQESPQAIQMDTHSENSTEKSSLEISSGSSGEEDEFRKQHSTVRQHNDLTLLLNFRKRKADSSNLSVCSSDSLDESKSSSSDGTSPEFCDFAPGEITSVSSSSKDDQKTVPPLTVRLHTKSVTKCVTVEGQTVSVGDIVWGKIHGFPWWPARVLSINTSRKEDGEPLWQEAKVSWFGSPTTSLLSVSKLSPFLEFFRLRFNRKKKGMYRRAITEAAKAAEHLTPEITSLLAHCEA